MFLNIDKTTAHIQLKFSWAFAILLLLSGYAHGAGLKSQAQGQWFWEALDSSDSDDGSVFYIPAGEKRYFAVPTHRHPEYLRLKLSDNEVESSLSFMRQTINGFMVSHRPTKTSKGDEYLFETADDTSGWEITNNGKQELKLYGSWLIFKERKTTSNYRYLAFEKGDKASNWYHRHLKNTHSEHVMLQAGEPYRINVDELQRWKLDVLPIVNESSGGVEGADFDIDLRLDDEPWKTWKVFKHIDHKDYWESSQCDYLTGYRQHLELTLPTSTKQLVLTSQQPILIRVFSLENSFLIESNDEAQGSNNSEDVRFIPDYEPDLLAFLERTVSIDEHVLLSKTKSLFNDVVQKKERRKLFNRYQYWRNAPLSSDHGLRRSRELVQKLRPYDNRIFYHNHDEKNSTQTLLFSSVASEQSVKVALPRRSVSPIKGGELLPVALRFTMSAEVDSHDWKVIDQLGKSHVLRWRSSDFSTAYVEPYEDGIKRVVSTELIFKADQFPLSIVNVSLGSQDIAVQYQTDKNLKVDLEKWHDLVGQLGYQHSFNLIFQEKQPSASSEQLLWNSWNPLRLWAKGYRESFMSGMDVKPGASRRVTKKTVLNWIKTLESEQELLLLEGLLKGVVASSAKSNVWRAAYDWLDRYYAQHDLTAKHRALYVMSALRLSKRHEQPLSADDWQFLWKLAEHLQNAGLSEMAAKLYLLNDGSAPIMAMRSALAQAGWLMPKDESSYENSVIRSLANESLTDLNAKVRQPGFLNKNDPLTEMLADIPNEGDSSQWLQWIDRLSKRTVAAPLVSVPLLATASKSTAKLYNTVRELESTHDLVAPTGQTEYTIRGPVDITVDARIVAKSNEERLSDWLTIEHNDDSNDVYYFPMLNRAKSARMIWPGHDDVYQLSRAEIRLGSGIHRLKISTLKHMATLKVSVSTPSIAASIMKTIQSGFVTTVVNKVEEKQGFHLPEVHLINACGLQQSTDNRLLTLESNDQNQGEYWIVKDAIAKSLAIQSNLTNSASYSEQLLSALWKKYHLSALPSRQSIARLKYNGLKLTKAPKQKLWLADLSQDYSWAQDIDPIQSLGRVRIVNPNDHQSPYFKHRELIMGVDANSTYKRLFGYKPFAIFTNFKEHESVILKFNQRHIPFREFPPAIVKVTLNDKQIKRIVLRKANVQLRLTIPKGEQRLVVSIENPTLDHWVYVQAEANIEGVKRSLIEENIRYYHVSSRSQPLVIDVPNTTLLRIDEYKNQQVSYRYRLAKKGELALYPSQGNEKSLYRVYSFENREGYPRLRSHSYRQTPNFIQKPNDEEISIGALYLAHTLSTYDFTPNEDLGGTKNDTHSYYFTHEQRQNFESASSGDEKEEFVELGFRYREKLECYSCYLRGDVFLRDHTNESISLVGGDLWLEGGWKQSSWRWATKQSLFAQMEPEQLYQWYGNVSLDSRHNINENQSHKHELLLFARYLSENNVKEPSDNDVFTDYKTQHRFGLRLSESYDWRPWLDSLFNSELALITNEDLSPFEPDHAQLKLAWQQYWVPVKLGLNVRYRYYFSDDDRQKDIDQTIVGLDIMAWRGNRFGNVWKLNTRFDHQLEEKNTSFTISLSWDHANGRGLYDSRPSENAFRSLMEDNLLNDHELHTLDRYEN